MPGTDPLQPTFERASSVLVVAAGRASAAVFDRFVSPRVDDGPLMAVLYERDGTSFVEELAASPSGCPDDVRVLDAGGSVRSTDAAYREDSSRTSVVGVVEWVGDVATVEQELERSLEAWASAGEPAVLYVDSLNPLVRTIDPPLVGDFLERITATLDRRNAFGVIQIDPAELDERTLEGLGHRADAVVELAGDDAEYSVVDPGAAAWLAAGVGVERPSPDVAFDLLRAPERRAVLAYLSIAGTATLDDLAGYLSRHPAVGAIDPETLRVALYQVHLPKLADAGAIELDREGRLAELEPPGEALVPFLAVASAYDRPDRSRG